ncbi:hypothetical protein OEZ86_007195 [Tetradesmus obliquus]|nr:hypothetical protein OEZ86_007195 [Tetradesmus obliquus]
MQLRIVSYDCYCLFGSVGAGKSVFSRAFIRAAAQDPTLPVPSPTYLLQLIYEEQEGPPIHHFDLYRLDSQQDMSRLDLAASFSSAQQQQQDDLLQSVRDTGDEEFEEAEDEYEELFTDKRQRLVRLRAFGKDWAERVQQLAQHMQ